MNNIAKTLLFAFALATAGCSASTAATQIADGTQCKVSTDGYVRGAYVDKVCTDPSGNTTTKRVASSGLYE